jgi:spore germination protein YaaH
MRRVPALAMRAALAVGLGLAAIPVVSPGSAAAATPTVAPLRAGQVRQAGHDVVGYLPTWELASTPAASLRLDVLTIVALFDVPIRRDGSLDKRSAAYAAVMGSRATAVIQRAHAAGVRVVVTLTSFGAAANATVLRSATARARLVRDAVALVRARGADGIDLDIEAMRASELTAYGQLVRTLGVALRRADPAARLSVAVDANGVGARMGAVAVKGGADRVFVMAYGMRTSGSATAGSIDPIDRPGSTYSIHGALDLFAATGVPVARTVLGLPLYGMIWPTTGAAQNAPTRGAGAILLASRIVSTIPSGAKLTRDAREGTSHWTWYDRSAKTWRQAYIDDPASIGTRVTYAIDRRLAGVGLWALGYDRGQPAYWSSIVVALRRDATAPVLTAVSVRWDAAHRRWQATWKATDAGSGVARYRVVYQVTSGDYRTLAGGSTTSATIAAPRNARVRVAIQVVDKAGNASPWRFVTGTR